MCGRVCVCPKWACLASKSVFHLFPFSIPPASPSSLLPSPLRFSLLHAGSCQFCQPEPLTPFIPGLGDADGIIGLSLGRMFQHGEGTLWLSGRNAPTPSDSSASSARPAVEGRCELNDGNNPFHSELPGPFLFWCLWVAFVASPSHLCLLYLVCAT